jgi:hypothetical protein
MRRLLLFLTAAALLGAPAAAEARTFYGTVGPGTTIALKRADGTLVRRVPAGYHRFVIRDRSAQHNFHLRGGGVDRRTGVAFAGTRTWTGVRIRRGIVYTYYCEPHASTMRRTFSGV